ncbi:hypothetical protein H4R33_003120 [Dimargaris cristalligena]|uniref:Uncharacterized protein n=1 Tax=Dimargaris cristalligena TaxID=215637 RepID=A0A4P9ZMV9_9FUNG|nr:hypothetical protein H4R33_003120 [Dimargaris cristalligena]RKP34583.1 hypothetical protein BJ085DRAFT_37088 [Dimargaris cristalligena]|eukprot:RKP34583.1 hypothetical protein BJ085DRAFT_37088 [Dimargaris cristalligena]
MHLRLLTTTILGFILFASTVQPQPIHTGAQDHVMSLHRRKSGAAGTGGSSSVVKKVGEYTRNTTETPVFLATSQLYAASLPFCCSLHFQNRGFATFNIAAVPLNSERL